MAGKKRLGRNAVAPVYEALGPEAAEPAGTPTVRFHDTQQKPVSYGCVQLRSETAWYVDFGVASLSHTDNGATTIKGHIIFSITCSPDVHSFCNSQQKSRPDIALSWSPVYTTVSIWPLVDHSLCYKCNSTLRPCWLTPYPDNTPTTQTSSAFSPYQRSKQTMMPATHDLPTAVLDEILSYLYPCHCGPVCQRWSEVDFRHYWNDMEREGQFAPNSMASAPGRRDTDGEVGSERP